MDLMLFKVFRSIWDGYFPLLNAIKDGLKTLVLCCCLFAYFFASAIVQG